jgi:CBS domain-containing protein
MRISDVIRRKGGEVVTVAPDASVRALLDLLAQHRIGAVVVSQDGSTVAGIVSERDVVRHLQVSGAQALDLAVDQIMTREVRTCSPDDGLEDLMRVMTDARVRHVPVVVDGALTGIISIGDVVKHRIDELQVERDQLVGYLQQ